MAEPQHIQFPEVAGILIEPGRKAYRVAEMKPQERYGMGFGGKISGQQGPHRPKRTGILQPVHGKMVNLLRIVPEKDVPQRGVHGREDKRK
jgi:hypothetical protein